MKLYILLVNWSFCHYKWPSVSLVISLKLTSPEINITIQAFFQLGLMWYIFFHSFIFFTCCCFYILVFCRHIYLGLDFFLNPIYLNLSIEVFRPLNVINYWYDWISLYLLIICFLFVLQYFVPLPYLSAFFLLNVRILCFNFIFFIGY